MKVDAKRRRNGPRLYGIRSINVAVSEFIVITHPQVDAMGREKEEFQSLDGGAFMLMMVPIEGLLVQIGSHVIIWHRPIKSSFDTPLLGG